MKKKIYTICVQKVYRTNIKKNSIHKVIFKLISSLIPDYRKARDKLNRLVSSCKYEDSEIVANYFGAWGEKEIFLKERCFSEGRMSKFENIDKLLNYDFVSIDEFKYILIQLNVQILHLVVEYFTTPEQQEKE